MYTGVVSPSFVYIHVYIRVYIVSNFNILNTVTLYEPWGVKRFQKKIKKSETWLVR